MSLDPEADDDQELDEDQAIEEAIELDTQSQIFLEMRRQNLDLLKIAVEVSGFGGVHPPIKPQDTKNVMKTIWEVYSEIYAWVDPEEAEDDDEDDDES